MNKIVFSFSLLVVSTAMLTAQNAKLIPLTERVNVQADSARINQVIDGCWVAVGTDILKQLLPVLHRFQL